MDNDNSQQPKPDNPHNLGNNKFSGRVIQPVNPNIKPEPVSRSTTEPKMPDTSSSEPTTYESFSTTPVNHTPSRTVAPASFAPIPAVTTEETSESNVLANIFVIVYGVLQLISSIGAIAFGIRFSSTIGTIYLVVGILALLISILFLLRREIARTITVILQAISVAGATINVLAYAVNLGSAVGGYYSVAGLLSYIGVTVICIFVLICLTRPSVKALFR